jgi:uncharacterized RmlC-like cupin family protein
MATEEWLGERRRGQRGMREPQAVRLIRPGDRREGQTTPGMRREEAIATERMWAGLVRTAPGMVSGWHHHGIYETAICVLTGALTMEFGPGGVEVVEARPGDFLFVEPGAIHRESNPSTEECAAVIVRAGSGDPVVNVDGPPPPR